MKKLFKEKTLFIKDGVMLEEVRDILFKNDEDVRLGYDHTYDGDNEVSSGYFHCLKKRFYLSKNTFEKEVMTYEDFISECGNKSVKKHKVGSIEELQQYATDYCNKYFKNDTEHPAYHHTYTAIINAVKWNDKRRKKNKKNKKNKK